MWTNEGRLAGGERARGEALPAWGSRSTQRHPGDPPGPFRLAFPPMRFLLPPFLCPGDSFPARSRFCLWPLDWLLPSAAAGRSLPASRVRLGEFLLWSARVPEKLKNNRCLFKIKQEKKNPKPHDPNQPTPQNNSYSYFPRSLALRYPGLPRSSAAARREPHRPCRRQRLRRGRRAWAACPALKRGLCSFAVQYTFAFQVSQALSG